MVLDLLFCLLFKFDDFLHEDFLVDFSIGFSILRKKLFQSNTYFFSTLFASNFFLFLFAFAVLMKSAYF